MKGYSRHNEMNSLSTSVSVSRGYFLMSTSKDFGLYHDFSTISSSK